MTPAQGLSHGIGRKEARVHATLAAALLWAFALLSFVATPGSHSLMGRLKGGDFVHFYTIGWLARTRNTSALTDPAALHDAQVALVPSSVREKYLPAYPPQTALVFAPFSLLPYWLAYVCWISLTAIVYAYAVRYATRGVSSDRWLIIAAAAAFAPFWSLVLHGQSTVLPLLAFLLAAVALSRGHEGWAGAALGLLATKPQFALLLPLWLLAARRWRMIAGATLSVAAQLAVVAVLLGFEAWRDYAAVVRALPSAEAQLEPRPWLMHSLRSLAKLFPFSTAIWLVGAAVVAAFVVRVGRAAVPPSVQLAVFVVGAVLVSPHLTVYDATVLVVPLPIVGRWLAEVRPDVARRFWPAVYALAVCYFIPTAAVIGVQVSVVVLAWIFWQTTAAALATNRLPATGGSA